MKALVIGGTGPTGPYVIKGLLDRGYGVTILHRGTHEIDLPKEVEHIHGDPHFVETLEQALTGHNFDLAVAMYGRLRHVAAVLQGKVERFISVGGPGVYRGWINLDSNEVLPIPIPEDSPLQTDPQVDKFTYRMVEAEKAVLRAYQEGYYSVTHYRYPMVYGPRQLAPREWSVIRRILDGRKRMILPDAGLSIESRGYVENMAHAVLLAVDQPEASAGQIYNARDESVFTLRAWANAICRIMGHQLEFVALPYTLSRPARIYSGRSQIRMFDITKIQSQLGYKDVITASKGLEATVHWYLEHRPIPGGKQEETLGDAFDYALEDQLMDRFLESVSVIKKLQPPRLGFRHPYDHPKKPEKIIKSVKR
jgi:nucleoside-diphosphate-sugar epimerase